MNLRQDRARTPYDSIAPLINLSFLLLVYFLLIGTFDASAPFDVYPPVARTGQDLPAGGSVLSLSADGDVAFDGETVERETLEAVARAAISASPEKRFLRVNADGRLRVQEILPLIDLMETAGATTVVLVVTPPG